MHLMRSCRIYGLDEINFELLRRYAASGRLAFVGMDFRRFFLWDVEVASSSSCSHSPVASVVTSFCSFIAVHVDVSIWLPENRKKAKLGFIQLLCLLLYVCVCGKPAVGIVRMMNNDAAVHFLCPFLFLSVPHADGRELLWRGNYQLPHMILFWDLL